MKLGARGWGVSCERQGEEGGGRRTGEWLLQGGGGRRGWGRR